MSHELSASTSTEGQADAGAHLRLISTEEVTCVDGCTEVREPGSTRVAAVVAFLDIDDSRDGEEFSERIANRVAESFPGARVAVAVMEDNLIETAWAPGRTCMVDANCLDVLRQEVLDVVLADAER